LSNALKRLRMSDVAAELDKHFEESHHNAPWQSLIGDVFTHDKLPYPGMNFETCFENVYSSLRATKWKAAGHSCVKISPGNLFGTIFDINVPPFRLVLSVWFRH
jgi:hypothetical protein